MKIQVLIAGLVLMVSALFIGNGKTMSLKGKIQDYAGMGIVFSSLEIYAKDAGNQLVYKTETSLDGDFTLNNLRPGIYEMVIKAPGFDDKVQTLDLTKKTEDLGVIKLDGNVITLRPAVIYGENS